MSRWVDEHSNVFLGLACREGGTQCKRLLDGLIQIADLKVEVRHRALDPFDRWPARGHVPVCLLKYEKGHIAGRCEDRRARFLMTDGPDKQLGVETRKRSRVRRLYSSSPPHASGA